MKKVSIIIPCYNQGKYLKEALNSAFNQTYKNLEVICINDASTDNTSEIIKEFSDKSNLVYIEEKENKGVIFARNKAIEKSTGDYILPLDADDKIAPAYIEKAVKVLDEDEDVGIVYCKARLFGRKNKEWKWKKFSKEELPFSNTIFASALFRKTDFQKAGGYKDYMKYGCEDWDLWLSFLEIGLDAYRIDEILFFYRKYKETSRSNICSKHIDEVFQNLVKHHISLYLENPLFTKKIFKSVDKKFKKYKKLFLYSLVIIFLQLLTIIVLCIH